MQTNLSGHHVSVAAVLLTASLLTAACGSAPVTVTDAAAPKPLASGSWPYSNGDLSNNRNAADSTITSTNVSGLTQAWTFHITGPAAAGVGPDGALAANPIVVNGVVYIQDLDANVYALALATGRLKWEHELQYSDEDRAGTGRCRGRRRDRVRSLADSGVRAECPYG